MTVRELRTALGAFPPDAEVWVASDAEGNDFAILQDLDAGTIVSGQLVEAPHKKVHNSVVLWPA